MEALGGLPAPTQAGCCGDTEHARAEPRRKDVFVPENVRRGALWGQRLRPFLMRTTMLTCAIF